MGNRLVKENKQTNEKQIYIRDAQGNVMAIYEDKNDSLFLDELHLYGSSRLGVIKESRLLAKYVSIFPPSSPLKINTPNTPYIPAIPKSIGGSITPITPIPLPYNFVYYYFGKKHYELADWLGNVRVVINDKKTPQGTNASDMTYAAQVLEVSDYYPFGMEIRERSYENVKYRFGFNTQEKIRELNEDHYTAKFWEYDGRSVLRWNIDPKPNLSFSPYAINQCNPIWFSDIFGDTVRIQIGESSFVNYIPGMKYKGDNKFVTTLVNILNTMNSTEIGNKLLSELSASKNYFDFTKSIVKDTKGNEIKNTLSFSEYKNGGGEIKAGALLNNHMQEFQKIEAVAHELFHGYQTEKGEKGATINREISASLFGRAINANLGYLMTGFGNFTKAGQIYNEAMNELLSSDKFDINLYKTALKNFKAGSVENSSGLYNNFKILSNDNNPTIKSFFPLIKNK